MKIKTSIATKINRAKAKLDAKCNDIKTKTKAKIAKKCIAAGALLAASVAFIGCQSAPSRAQTMNFSHCDFDFYGGGVGTNELARIELGTHAMSIENSGTETQSHAQTPTVSPTFDTSLTH